MLYYKINVMDALKEKGYSSYRILKEKTFGMNATTKFRNGEMVSANVLNKLCSILEMQPGEIIGYKAD